GRRPPLDRGREGVLDSFFGEIDVAEGAHQHGHGAAVLLAEHPLDVRFAERAHVVVSPLGWRIGRTSIGSVVARASLRPHSSAASRSGALMMVNPPTCSLPSTNGPSVVSDSPSFTRTTVAVLAG